MQDVRKRSASHHRFSPCQTGKNTGRKPTRRGKRKGEDRHPRPQHGRPPFSRPVCRGSTWQRRWPWRLRRQARGRGCQTPLRRGDGFGSQVCMHSRTQYFFSMLSFHHGFLWVDDCVRESVCVCVLVFVLGGGARPSLFFHGSMAAMAFIRSTLSVADGRGARNHSEGRGAVGGRRCFSPRAVPRE